MTAARKYFGTDGIRGVANKFPLDPETIVRLGRAIAKVLLTKRGRRHRVIIGKDTRLSGYMLEHALTTGLNSMGVDVMLTGPIPSAGIAYLTKSMRADAGIVISASHNSYEDNGIKIFGSDGFKLADAVEYELEALMQPGAIPESCDSASIGKAFRIDDALGRYTVNLKSTFPRELSLEGLRIGIDCGNGAAYHVAPQTFDELGAEVVCRGNSPNGRNINGGFGSEFPEVIKSLVKEYNLDFGLALDGDADRAVIVDDSCRIWDGDMVLALCAEDLNSRGLLMNSTVVGTVMSNMGLELYLAERGIKLLRAAVGDRYVLEELRRNSISLGGEQSGHTIFLNHSTCGDGILTALRVLEIMLSNRKKLSELLVGYQKFPQKLLNVKVTKKPDLDTIPELQNIIKNKEDELAGHGRILVRYSGTENKARVMVECEDPQECARHASEVAEVIEKSIGII